MLPWMKSKPQQTGVAVIERNPDETKEESGEDEGLNACGRDLIDAISSGDEAKVAAALRAAFQILDSEPYEEDPHTNEEAE